MSKKRTDTTGIPEYQMQALARFLLPAIRKYYETEEGKRDFELWQAERQEQLNKKPLNKESH